MWKEATTRLTYHWELGTIRDGEVALKSQSEEHLCQFLLGEAVKWTISLRKVESIQAKIETHTMKMGGTGGCREGVENVNSCERRLYVQV